MNPYLAIFQKTDDNDWTERRWMTKKFSWAVPSEAALDVISKYGSMVEIGAGTGYWAKLLKERGVNILPFEKYFYEDNPYGHTEEWTEVCEGDESILDKFHKSVNLFLCWPPAGESMAYDCVVNFKGEYIMYIGEIYGCTADDDFHCEIYDNWEEVEHCDIPNWHGASDALYVYKRK